MRQDQAGHILASLHQQIVPDEALYPHEGNRHEQEVKDYHKLSSGAPIEEIDIEWLCHDKQNIAQDEMLHPHEGNRPKRGV